jgi:Spy/CpxP family protein refolding chaperone
MKIKHTLTLLLVLLSLNSFAQEGDLLGKKGGKIKALKVAFITNELALTPEESAKFWPLYNAFEEKQKEIKKLRLRGVLTRMDEDSFAKLSDKEATALLAQIESYEEELYQAKKKFVTSLKNVLTPRKILQLKRAEDNFNIKLLQQYRKNN